MDQSGDIPMDEEPQVTHVNAKISVSKCQFMQKSVFPNINSKVTVFNLIEMQ